MGDTVEIAIDLERVHYFDPRHLRGHPYLIRTTHDRCPDAARRGTVVSWVTMDRVTDMYPPASGQHDTTAIPRPQPPRAATATQPGPGTDADPGHGPGYGPPVRPRVRSRLRPRLHRRQPCRGRLGGQVPQPAHPHPDRGRDRRGRRRRSRWSWASRSGRSPRTRLFSAASSSPPGSARATWASTGSRRRPPARGRHASGARTRRPRTPRAPTRRRPAVRPPPARRAQEPGLSARASPTSASCSTWPSPTA